MMGKIARIYLAFFLVMGSGLCFFASRSSATRAELEAGEALSAQQNPAPAAFEGERIIRPRVTFNAKDKRDPFNDPRVIAPQLSGQEQAGEGSPLPALKVQGIIWGGNFSQAIINNKVVKTGDSVEGCRVLKIEKNGVSMSFGVRQFVLPSPASGGSVPEKPLQGG